MSFFGYVFFFGIAWAIGKYGLSGVVRLAYRTFRQVAGKVDSWIAQEEKEIREAVRKEQM